MRYLLRIVLGVIAIAATLPVCAADFLAQVASYRAAHEREIVSQLDELTRLRSVAADPAGLAATADRLESLLEQRGFETKQLKGVPGAPPLVFGSLSSPGAKRTVVFYAHYDGQPVAPSEWKSDPFDPVMRSGERDVDWRSARPPFDPEWRLYGRAASDDKASIVAFLAAFDALKASGRKPSVNIKVVWEGEEESGSPHLAATLRADPALFASDLWLIGDGPVHQSARPMVYFGARGISSVEATIYGANRALHSGHYGNWAPNPAAMAAKLLAELRDDNGRILVSGIEDDVRPLTLAEQDAIRNLPPIEETLRRELAIAESEGDETLAASLMRPALNVRGIRSGQVGAAAVTAIPTTALVSIDFRLVPDQTPEKLKGRVEAFLKSKGWTVVADEPDLATRLAHPRIVRLEWNSGYPALRSDLSTPAAKAVITAANQASNGTAVILPMMGGSVPIYLFGEIFKTPVIGLPIVNHDNNQHAANENLRLQNLWNGIQAYASMMGSLNW